MKTPVTLSRARGLLLAPALALTLVAAPALAQTDRGAALRIVAIDTEGGAATLIVTPEGQSLLIDAGWPSDLPPPRDGGQFSDPSVADLIVRTAAGLGVKKIDYLLVTHYHLDHVGGVPELLDRIPIGTVVDHGPNRELSSDPAPANSAADLFVRYEAAVAGLPRQIANVGETLTIGSLTLTFVASDAEILDGVLDAPGTGQATPGCGATPEKTFTGWEENHHSIGFVASFGDARILNLADLTWNLEKQLVCPINRLGEIDLLLVSHHGSGASTTPPLLTATAPRVAVMGNGSHKGGDASVFEALAAAPSAPVVWQQHFAQRSPEANVDEARIANLAVHMDAGHSLDVSVWPNGEMRVTNQRNGHSQHYPASPR